MPKKIEEAVAESVEKPGTAGKELETQTRR
jgi:hypothetical protein